MSGKRRRLNKKEYERLERERAEEEAKARSDSEKRQERIKELWNLITSGKLSPRGDESENVARDLKSEIEDEVFGEWTTVKKAESEKGLRRRDRNDTHQRRFPNELGRSLVELVRLQKLEIEYLTQFRRDWEEVHAHYPEQLENLSFASFRAAWEPLFEKLAAEREKKPKKAWERQRGRYRRLIEYEFGGDGEAEWRKRPLSGLSGLPYQPTCLDDILRGGIGEVKRLPNFFGGPPITVDTVTNMRRLQDLFGVHRDRFRKRVQGRRMGTKIVYEWWEVVEIMDALLSKRHTPRKRSGPGRPRTRWLSDPDLRNRVLSGIEARINSISVPKEIATAFLDLVRRHRVDSAKK